MSESIRLSVGLVVTIEGTDIVDHGTRDTGPDCLTAEREIASAYLVFEDGTVEMLSVSGLPGVYEALRHKIEELEV